MVQIIRLKMTLEMDLVHFITCVKCERIFFSGLDVTDHLEEHHDEMSIPNFGDDFGDSQVLNVKEFFYSEVI